MILNNVKGYYCYYKKRLILIKRFFSERAFSLSFIVLILILATLYEYVREKQINSSMNSLHETRGHKMNRCARRAGVSPSAHLKLTICLNNIN